MDYLPPPYLYLVGKNNKFFELNIFWLYISHLEPNRIKNTNITNELKWVVFFHDIVLTYVLIFYRKHRLFAILVPKYWTELSYFVK